MSLERFLNSERVYELWDKIKSSLAGKQNSLTPDETLNLTDDSNISVKLPTKSVTQAEYDALTEEQKNADVLYVVDEPEWIQTTISVQEYDTEDGWHVRKYSDGYVEMWKKYESISVLGTLWSGTVSGIGYVVSGLLNETFPFSLTEKISESVTTLESPLNFRMLWTSSGEYESGLQKSNVWSVIIFQDVGSFSATISCQLYVKGRWK